MADNSKIAEAVLAAVGGASNVTSATHCMTRLRLNLKDQSVPDDGRVRAIDGVLGAQWSGGQYQVIIGQNVPKVYEALMALGVAGDALADERLGEADGAEGSTPNGPRADAPGAAPGGPAASGPKAVVGAVLNYLSKSMIQVLPIIMGAAMCRTVAVLAGPDMLGIWSTDSAVYNLFYNWLYNAGYYFLPITLGWSAATQLGASPQLGMMLGGILIAPDLMTLLGQATQTGATTTSVYGMPAVLNNYSSTVLPIIICMPALWQVERLFKRIVPDMLAMVLVPCLTIAVMTPIALVALAPLGSILGNLLGTFVFGLGNVGGIVSLLAIVLVAALWEFLVMTGMHTVLMTLAIAQLLSTGADSFVLVAGIVATFATWGTAFGAFLRLRERDEKADMLGYSISGILGGVTEPALYGCGFKYVRSFSGIVLGGALGGLVAGLFHCTIYVFGASNFLVLAGFLAGGTQNLVWGCVACAVAFVGAAAITFAFGFSKEELARDAEAASAQVAPATA